MRQSGGIPVGTRFGYLEVLGKTDPIQTGGRGRAASLCRCCCGRELAVRNDHLKTHNSTSCGCMHGNAHGLSTHRLYQTWYGMVQRCSNPQRPDYSAYGAKGITVCERWKTLENFIQDMDASYVPGLTLERIDNMQGYSLDNCKWASRKQQASNRSSNIWVVLDGKRMIASDAAAKLGKTRHNLFTYANYHGISTQQAVDHYASKRPAKKL